MKMRITEAGRRRLYLTRDMVAGQDEIEVDPRSAEAMRVLGYATDLPAESAEPAAKPRGRPRKAAPVEPEAPAKPEDPNRHEFEHMTVPDLREMAEEKGVELPTGYVRKDELVELLEQTDEADKG